jgi:hypothetical protein
LGSVVVVVVDDVVEGGEPAGDVVVEDEVVVELLSLLEGDDGGVDGDGGGTTTVVDGEVGGADELGVDGVCCWQAPSASRMLAATAMDVSRVIFWAPSRERPRNPA